ncbi:MAG: Gfo/Idh/MocA family oxidoreductase [Gammaproteobacteria bacterium]|nr:Gfo/Idh/MocA family oxidoreductase [Gammaproteobacteria bacterium]MDE0259607.1 Gfo/Idh/MocA family oxidoreductase [Gammaproteobacteria bacterium]
MNDDDAHRRKTRRDSGVEDHATGAPTALNRRDFLKAGALGVAAGAAAGCTEPRAEAAMTGAQAQASATGATPQGLPTPPAQPLAAPPLDPVRIGFVGVGGMGTAHVRNLVRIDGCVVTAVCDIRAEHAERAAAIIEEAGHPGPALYTRGERDFERLCGEADLDLVYTATPWRWHVPVCVAAMENGKHAATEVPAAYTLDDCWRLVETAERTARHCVMMENVNYGRAELLCLNLVRQGLLGEILHGECGYLHDLREIKFADEGEGLWRRAHSWTRNGNLYPTHGLGPVANCMDINRGDRFASLVSMSSPSRGLQEWAAIHYGTGHPKRAETFALGDVNASLIQTAMGRTIYVAHDTNLPRPYDRINKVQGTRGIFQGYPDRVYIEGRSESHRWDDAEAWYGEHEHPLWSALREASIGAGHGGMDFMEDYRLIKCLREGLPTDMNVYDAAALSAVCELSEISVAQGAAPVPFPDFTRGKWRDWQPWPIVTA